ncbi:MAG: arginine deiminase-related protein [Nocardioides sp.]|jgi:hypothetical protein
MTILAVGGLLGLRDELPRMREYLDAARALASALRDRGFRVEGPHVATFEGYAEADRLPTNERLLDFVRAHGIVLNNPWREADTQARSSPNSSLPLRPSATIPSRSRTGWPQSWSSLTTVSAQAPSAVILIRAERFRPNPATAADNAFQADVPVGESDLDVAGAALAEMDAVAEALRQAGVTVHVFEDQDHTRPDSVFPNNWLSTHAGGNVAVYPMYASNRRHERRADVLEFLKSNYRVQTIVDYSGLEPDGIFLEGTGAMVLDHISRVAYTARSHRADTHVLERFCTDFGYEPMAFDAVDSDGVPVYHTNVIACVGTEVALFALEMIPDVARREQVRERLSVRGRTVIEITEAQVREFAGNAVELTGRTPEGHRRSVLAMSARARASLTAEQVTAIEQHCEIVAVEIPTIELAGGSVRCMIAGVHLDRRPATGPELTEAVEAINEDNPVTADGRYVDTASPEAVYDVESRAEEFSPDLLSAIRAAIGEERVVHTLGHHRPNTIVELGPSGILVENERTQNRGAGPQLVPAWMFESAWQALREHGRLSNRELLASDDLNIKRSSFVCAVLAKLPEVEVVGTSPVVLERVVRQTP